jgi:hypothetical protein
VAAEPARRGVSSFWGFGAAFGHGGTAELHLVSCLITVLSFAETSLCVFNQPTQNPITQTPPSYALIGLEQTADSAPLPAFPFPRRAALVLGREKQGLPPELLALMDACVEIPQFGVVRSLNVHVSAAVAMYEYLRQGPLVGGGVQGGTGGGGNGGGASLS